MFNPRGTAARALVLRLSRPRSAFVVPPSGHCARGRGQTRGLLSRTVLGLPREASPLDLWAEQYEEDAIEPDIAIFDPHHHLFNILVHPVPAVTKAQQFILSKLKPHVIETIMNKNLKYSHTYGEKAPFVSTFMGEQVLETIRGPSKRGHNVTGTVFVECGWADSGVEECMKPVGEVAMVTDVHRKFPQICQGIVASADLRLGAAVEPALAEYARNPLVKGIRHGLAWSADPVLAHGVHASKNCAFDAKFREGFALLEKYGLSFDSWHYHENMPDFLDLAKCFPGTTMILDHMGFPVGIGTYDRTEVFPVWKEQMQEMAKQENVVVKIGGLGMPIWGFGFDKRAKPATSDELAEIWGPYVRHTIETFGVDRCMMESNFPMDKVSCSYTVLFNALKKTVSNYSKEDKHKLFELNARRVYRI